MGSIGVTARVLGCVAKRSWLDGLWAHECVVKADLRKACQVTQVAF